MQSAKSIYNYYPPENQLIGLVSIPHSGEEIPNDFEEYLTKNEHALAEDVDLRVDHLIDIPSLQKAGIAVLVAKVHRCCLDLNRPPQTACLNWKNNTKGVLVVIQEPDVQTIVELTQRYHEPYYAKIDEILNQYSTAQRPLPIIDLHSMPSKATAHHLKNNPNQSQSRPDICVSDYNGTSCSHDYIQFITQFFSDRGLESKINDPYSGGYITQYLAPKNCQNVQIEINRAIYMDEEHKWTLPLNMQRLVPLFSEMIMETFQRF